MCLGPQEQAHGAKMQSSNQHAGKHCKRDDLSKALKHSIFTSYNLSSKLCLSDDLVKYEHSFCHDQLGQGEILDSIRPSNLDTLPSPPPQTGAREYYIPC